MARARTIASPLLRAALHAACACAAAVAVAACVHDDPPAAASEVLEAGPGARWYRGNLHAHTLRTDGNAPPEVVAAWYRSNGYHFLAITDHDAVPEAGEWARLLAGANVPGSFLLLGGEEISDAVGSVSVHVNAVDTGALLAPARKSSVAATIAANHDAIARQAHAGGRDILAQLNHPNFAYSITAEHLMQVPGVGFFEVYNGHPLANNPGDGLRMSTESLWDVALAWRLDVLGLPLLYATATDDSHHYQPGGDAPPGRAWVQVLSGSLAPGALFAAMREGRFYASTGVSLKRVVATSDRMEVEVEPEPGTRYRIEFIGTRRGFDATAQPPVSATGRPIYASHRYDPAIGTVLSSSKGTRATYRFRDDDLYVRARVTASRPHHAPSQPLQFAQAWVQPVMGPAGRRPSRTGQRPPDPPAPDLHQGITGRFQPLPGDEATRLLSSPPIACSIDAVSDGTGAARAAYPVHGSVAFGGWIVDHGGKRVPGSFAVVLVGDRAYIAEDGPGRWRPDLAPHSRNPRAEASGFHSRFETVHVAPGDYRIRLVAFTDGASTTCDSGKSLRIDA